jgi:FKBP-type peptidyl-prolyl cis-trans isomerase SlyD
VIKKDSKVKINYSLKVDGNIVDSSDGKDPLSFVMGSGQMVRAVEKHLEGLGPGDSRVVTLTPEEGFGPRDPEAILKVPRDSFQNAESLEVGTIVAGKTEGKTFHASIQSLDEETVVLDLNHPLAGKTLEFNIEHQMVRGDLPSLRPQCSRRARLQVLGPGRGFR